MSFLHYGLSHVTFLLPGRTFVVSWLICSVFSPLCTCTFVVSWLIGLYSHTIHFCPPRRLGFIDLKTISGEWKHLEPKQLFYTHMYDHFLYMEDWLWMNSMESYFICESISSQNTFFTFTWSLSLYTGRLKENVLLDVKYLINLKLE